MESTTTADDIKHARSRGTNKKKIRFWYGESQKILPFELSFVRSYTMDPFYMHEISFKLIIIISPNTKTRENSRAAISTVNKTET